MDLIRHGGGAFHPGGCFDEQGPTKNIVVARMSSALKAIICALPIELIGAP